MDLCRELIWDCPCGRVQYYKLEEVDRVYDFLAGLNSKFDAGGAGYWDKDQYRP